MREAEENVRAPTLAETIRAALDSWGAERPQGCPGVVTKWDAGKQRANVAILIKKPYRDEDDERQVESAGVVPGVPVIFPGAGPWRITFPISDGSLEISGTKIRATTGWLAFSDRSMDRWLSGTGGEVDPEFDHFNAPADAVFYPGLNPFGLPIGDVATDHITIGMEGGPQIHIRKDMIIHGDESGAVFLPHGPHVETRIKNLEDAVNQLQFLTTEISATAGPYPVSGTVGPKLIPPITDKPDILLTQVKGK